MCQNRINMLKFNELPVANSERWLSPVDFPGEVWKEVPGFEGVVFASYYGRIVKIQKENPSVRIVIRYFTNPDGYYMVSLKRSYFVHRIIASAFLSNPENKPCVDHIDTNKKNNIVSNLKYVTHKENVNNEITKEHIREERRSRKGTPFSRKEIAKYDRNWNLICTYESLSKAAKENNLSISAISNAVYFEDRKNRHKQLLSSTAGGFYWRYTDT